MPISDTNDRSDYNFWVMLQITVWNLHLLTLRPWPFNPKTISVYGQLDFVTNLLYRRLRNNIILGYPKGIPKTFQHLPVALHCILYGEVTCNSPLKEKLDSCMLRPPLRVGGRWKKSSALRSGVFPFASKERFITLMSMSIVGPSYGSRWTFWGLLQAWTHNRIYALYRQLYTHCVS